MRKNIKVLHVIVSLGNGGAERQLMEILKHNRNHGVLLLSEADVYKETLDKLKIKYWEMRVKNKLLIFFKILFFRKVIRNYKPDIVQSWMYNACLFSVFCKLINLYDKPLIWNIRCSNMVTKHYSLSLKFIIYACVFLSKYVEKIIYNSYAGQAYHKKIGFSQKFGKVIYNGVDSKKFNSTITKRKVLRKKYNFDENDLVFMCVARVDPMKNYNNFLIISGKKFLNISNQLVLKNKPIRIFKLLEKINIEFLKLQFNSQSKVKVKTYTIDINSRELVTHDTRLKLTEKEINTIIYLSDSNEPVSIEGLQKMVWSYQSDIETHTVETHIYRLRKKILNTFNDKEFIISQKNGYQIK